MPELVFPRQDSGEIPDVRSFFAFFPAHLATRLVLGRERRAPPFAEREKAALLFADISGFTALTERLQARGREGAEEMAAVVTRAFRPAIRAVERASGSIINFGGDAIFCMFPGDGCVRRAHAAAREIAAAFERGGVVQTSAGPVQLVLSQVLHYGPVLGLHLGRFDRRHYLVAGPAVMALARQESRTTAGELHLSTAAGRELKVEESATAATQAAPDLEEEIDPMTDGEGTIGLVPYLPAHVTSQLGRFEGEYRRATILFIETRGYRLAAAQRFLTSLYEVLEAFEGILISSDLSEHGAKWLCAFGVPSAHEDDSERAARAVLGLAAQQGDAMRAALHCGTVVNVWVGTSWRRSFEVMGDVVNTCARTLGKASWGEVLITDVARQALSGMETAPRGLHPMKGKAEPVALHALVRALRTVRQVSVSARLVGRETEMHELTEAILSAASGNGDVLGLKGDAGMGKSRLKWEATKVATDQGFDVMEGRAASFAGKPYQLLSDLLASALSLRLRPTRDEILAGVAWEVERLGLSATDRHHLAEVLGARYDASPLPHLDTRAALLNNMLAAKTYLLARSREKPILVIFEDAHWSDEMSHEAVELLCRSAGTARMLVLLLYRPGFTAPPETREIEISELPEEAVGSMVEDLLGSVPPEVKELILDRADGNPFYVEELARHLQESGRLTREQADWEMLRLPGDHELPDGVDALLKARLDRLSPAGRRVAQLGSVMGRIVPMAVLEHLDGHRGDLALGVLELLGQEIVFERQSGPQRELIFKHALTRDVAYGTILVARRKDLHRSVAKAIEEVYASELDPHLSELGYHWEAAGDRTRAEETYLAGARSAKARHAVADAERLYQTFLKLAEAPGRLRVAARRELGGEILQPQGRAAEAMAQHRLAIEEARSLGDRELAADGLTGLSSVLRETGRLAEAQPLVEEAIAIYRELELEKSEATALNRLALLQQDQGRVGDALQLFRRVRELAAQLGDRQLEGLALGNLGSVEHQLGHMDEARSLYERAVAIDREVGDRSLEATGLMNQAVIHHEQGRLPEAWAMYELALSMYREVGDRRMEAIAQGNCALVLHQQGRLPEARALYHETLASLRRVGDRRFEGIALHNLASLARDEGLHDEARRHNETALAILRDVGDRRFEAITLSRIAELDAFEGRLSQARAGYEAALAIHVAVGDRRFQGVAMTGLAGLARLQGDLRGARELTAAAQSILEGVNDRLELGRCLCEQGHIALALREDAAPLLERLEAIVADIGASSESGLGHAASQLRRAIDAAAAGEPLLSGQAAGDVPDAVRRAVDRS
ncbi:MAG: tetratricopeptide repeat protein [Acidobacteriota bacterium]